MHVYVPSAPGCWAAFTSLQAHELERFGGHRAHGLVADCYMAQHPGDGSDRRDRQSVFVHLVGLCAVLERGWPNSRSLLALLTATRRQFPALTRPSDPGSICVNDLACVQDAIEYQSCAASWATEVWRSWAPAHGLIRAMLDELEHAPNRPARAAAARRSGSDMAGPWAERRCCYGTGPGASNGVQLASASSCRMTGSAARPAPGLMCRRSSIPGARAEGPVGPAPGESSGYGGVLPSSISAAWSR